MWQIKSFFKSMEESQKKQVFFFCICMGVLTIMYTMCMRMLYRQFDILTDDYSWMYQIDSMDEHDGKLQITGWAFAQKQIAKPKEFEIILHNTETGKNVYPKMNSVSREDVNDYFLCEYDYTESGFTATLSTEKLEEGTYEVLLRPSRKRIAYALGIYYADNKMTFVHPDTFIPLDVAGTDLEMIVKNGVLRVYRPDFDMYVYQYGGELYWIADTNYGFVDNDSYVQFQMTTTQIERLPEERLINGWNWSNIGFRFCENEVSEWNTGRYRVAKCALPKDYSVTQIWTGNYIDDWIWIQDFRPWYDFNTEN